MRREESAPFIDDVLMLISPLTLLLQSLDPEPEFVKKYLEDLCRRIKEEGWVEQTEEKGWVKSFQREKYHLKIALIHARKGEYVTGADLVFELKDKKIVFIQSKKVSTNGRISFDRFQLFKMIELEKLLQLHYFPDICAYCLAYRLTNEIPPKIPITTCKGTFYHLIMTEDLGQIQERFFHSSEISSVLGNRKSVRQSEFLHYGLDNNDFEKMFWECQIGCPDLDEHNKRELLYFYSLCTGRAVLLLNVEMVEK